MSRRKPLAKRRVRLLEVVRETVMLLRHSVFVPGAALVVALLRQAWAGSGLGVELVPVVITGATR